MLPDLPVFPTNPRDLQSCLQIGCLRFSPEDAEVISPGRKDVPVSWTNMGAGPLAQNTHKHRNVPEPY
jgi:hypothetical protein